MTEPTGLGAVVRDRDSKLWVRAALDEHPGWFNPEYHWHAFADLGPVEVLAEGLARA